MSKVIDLDKLYNSKSSLENKAQRPGVFVPASTGPSSIYGELACDIGSTGVTIYSIFNAPLSGSKIVVYGTSGTSASYTINSLYLSTGYIGACRSTGTISTPMILSSGDSSLRYTVRSGSSRPLGASIGGPVYGYGNLRNSTGASTCTIFMNTGFSTGDTIRYTRMSTGQTGTAVVASLVSDGLELVGGHFGDTVGQIFRANTPFSGSTCTISLDSGYSANPTYNLKNLRYISSRSKRLR
jgi:hypothetical protein